MADAVASQTIVDGPTHVALKLTNISDEGWTHFEVQVDYDDDMSADYLRNTHGFEDEMENA